MFDYSSNYNEVQNFLLILTNPPPPPCPVHLPSKHTYYQLRNILKSHYFKEYYFIQIPIMLPGCGSLTFHFTIRRRYILCRHFWIMSPQPICKHKQMHEQTMFHKRLNSCCRLKHDEVIAKIKIITTNTTTNRRHNTKNILN